MRDDDAVPTRDPQLRFVRETLLLLLIVATAATTSAAVLHALEPNPSAMDLIAPIGMALAFTALAVRHRRRPDRLVSTLWCGWAVVLGGVGVPIWIVVARALRGVEPLVEALPPISSILLPLLLVLVLFGRPRHAVAACVIAWLVIAAPVLGYLAVSPQELWTPRGMDLAIAMGPVALIVPLLIPLVRGAEDRWHALRREGERLQQLAERDALIGLYNRRAGERFLATLLAHERAEAALVLFDVDHFKQINDRHGHPAGDAVLIEIGRRCAQHLGAEDVFARWGGEEFLVLMPGAGAARAPQIAEALRDAIRATPITPVGTVTASFGVTTLRAQDTLGEVLQRADDALYRAKAGGRDRVVVI